jgi:putative transcriptional regulator
MSISTQHPSRRFETAGRTKIHRCAAMALCAALATASVFAQESARTLILVARPGLPDPNFRETVVLVTQDDRAAATGVIINRPTDRSLAQLLPGERFKRFNEPVLFGGPVAANELFAVFSADRDPDQSIAMLPGLYLAMRPDTIDALIGNPPQRIRFFSGYSGWAPGQLRAELERGDWLAVDAEADVVFRKDYSNLWQEMVRRATAVHADAGLPRRVTGLRVFESSSVYAQAR